MIPIFATPIPIFCATIYHDFVVYDVPWLSMTPITGLSAPTATVAAAADVVVEDCGWAAGGKVGEAGGGDAGGLGGDVGGHGGNGEGRGDEGGVGGVNGGCGGRGG